jgi:hypothetical protein
MKQPGSRPLEPARCPGGSNDVAARVFAFACPSMRGETDTPDSP